MNHTKSLIFYSTPDYSTSSPSKDYQVEIVFITLTCTFTATLQQIFIHVVTFAVMFAGKLQENIIDPLVGS